jgi:CheY-like chemotaxis protein
MATRQSVVLRVEDHEDSLAMYAIAFTASGFNVLSATDAAAAFALACAYPPDAVVLDERLPDRSGAELARDLSHNEATRGRSRGVDGRCAHAAACGVCGLRSVPAEAVRLGSARRGGVSSAWARDAGRPSAVLETAGPACQDS